MSVWFVAPSARPPAEANLVLAKWRAQGYEIALWLDNGSEAPAIKDAVLMSGAAYPGYANSVNALVAYVMRTRPDAEWFVVAGDDVEPDAQHTADEIAAQCREHFQHLAMQRHVAGPDPTAKGAMLAAMGGTTFGVMQPTGDRYGADERHLGKAGSAYIDRVAGSAWYGREYCRRVNQGKGPLWPEYFHMGVDEEARAVAVKLGVYWERPDLTHHHQHWARARKQASDMPAFLARANSAAEWAKYKEIYARREAAGFPGHEPL